MLSGSLIVNTGSGAAAATGVTVTSSATQPTQINVANTSTGGHSFALFSGGSLASLGGIIGIQDNTANTVPLAINRDFHA